MPEHLDQARIGAVMGGGFRRAHLMRRVRSGDDWRYPVFDSAPIKATLPASDIE